MRLLILLVLVSCSSFQKETVKDQNDTATQVLCPADRIR